MLPFFFIKLILAKWQTDVHWIASKCRFMLHLTALHLQYRVIQTLRSMSIFRQIVAALIIHDIARNAPSGRGNDQTFLIILFLYILNCPIMNGFLDSSRNRNIIQNNIDDNLAILSLFIIWLCTCGFIYRKINLANRNTVIPESSPVRILFHATDRHWQDPSSQDPVGVRFP